MSWKNIRTSFPGKRLLLLVALFLTTGQILADSDAAASYRHLDWISSEEIATLPPELRPVYTGICAGTYFAPELPSDPDGNIRASADSFTTLDDNRVALEGNVVVQQDQREMRSDLVQLNRATGDSNLLGNVSIRQPGLLVRGEEAYFNNQTKELDVRHTEYVAHDLHAHGRANRINNPAAKQFVLDRATYTTCEPGNASWQLSADRIKLDQASGWGQVRNATLEVEGIPVIYLPWWMFPIDERRQSGFLFPTLSSSSVDGFRMGIPYYLNLAPNYDATITPTYINRRGTLVEGEFRYLTPHTTGLLGGGYLSNDRLEEGDDRNMVVWKHKGNYGRMHQEVDYTRVGDSYYFDDLGTSIKTQTNTYLDQRTHLFYSGDGWNGSINLQQYQTIDEAIAINDLPYRRLPQITANRWLPTPHERLKFSVAGEYVYFEHPEQNDPALTVARHADRVRLSTTASWQMRGPWGFFIPSYTYRYRYYNMTGGPLDQQEPDLTAGLFSLDTGLFFDRSFRLLDHDFTQTLEPRIYYLYVPYVEQNHLPLFDTAKNSFGFEQLFRDNRFTGGDRIGDANQVSVGVTSRFIDHDTGMERLNLGLGQIFYLRDREVQLYPQDPVEDTTLSPLVARGLWYLNRHWTLRGETQYDTQMNNIDTVVAGIGFRSKSGNLVNLNYNQYDDGAITRDPGQEKIKQTDFSFMWSIAQKWGLLGRWVYDQNLHRSYDNLVGVEYESCCWRARLVNRRYLKESKDDPLAVEPVTGIYLQIELKGLGGMGGNTDRLLDESIPGYLEREAARPLRY